MITNWMHVGTASTVHWPTGDMSTRAASSTTTASAALGGRMTGKGITTIHSVQTGATHTAGELEIRGYNGTTLVREYPAPNSNGGNMAFNNNTVQFSFPGGFSAWCDSATTDIYIEYSYDERGNA